MLVSAPNFTGRYLGCIDAADSESRLIFEHFSRPMRFTTFAPSESNLKTMKSASGKRHPGNKAWREERKKVHSPTNSKIQLNFVKHVRILAVLFSKFD